MTSGSPICFQWAGMGREYWWENPEDISAQSRNVGSFLLAPNCPGWAQTCFSFTSCSFQLPCVALHLILHYFLLTNYAWMLCEGFYLHTVLVSAFISEQKLVKWLIAIGWSAPALFLIPYGVLRGYVSDEDDRILWVRRAVVHALIRSRRSNFLVVSDAGWTAVHTQTSSSRPCAYRCYLISSFCATSCEWSSSSSRRQHPCLTARAVVRVGIYYKLLGNKLSSHARIKVFSIGRRRRGRWVYGNWIGPSPGPGDGNQ